MAPVVEALQAMRGVALVTAVTLLAELGDLTRFEGPCQLMAHVGLVPRGGQQLCSASSGPSPKSPPRERRFDATRGKPENETRRTVQHANSPPAPMPGGGTAVRGTLDTCIL
jgi:hypothetical protein